MTWLNPNLCHPRGVSTKVLEIIIALNKKAVELTSRNMFGQSAKCCARLSATGVVGDSPVVMCSK